MRKLMTGIAVLLLVGCATPQEFVQKPHDGEFILKNTPELAAICVTRNLDTISSSMVTDRRPAPFGWELVARLTSDFTTVYAVGQFRPEGKGSLMRFWVVHHVFEDKPSVMARLVKGC